MMRTLRKSAVVFTLIMLAYSIYAGLFIYRTSYAIDGERYFVLFDDAMVSMRYARNLANGYGLVWNPGGERVEGYTNPLWVLYMSVFHLFPIALSKTSLLIQVSGALFLMVNLLVVKKIADFISDGSALVSTSAVLLTAFYLPLNNWGLQGMEVSVLALIVSVSIWKALQCIKLNRFSMGLYFLLGVSTLVRIDMIVPFLAILIYLVIVDPKNRGRHLLWGLGALGSFILLQTLFRVWYYGDILPNTYYLKMTGYPFLLRLARGAWVLLEFIWRMGWLVFLIPFSILLFRRDKFVFLLLGVFLAQVTYSVYVGGDAWESWGGSNRYISIVMPVFFILFCYGLVNNGLLLMSPTAKYAKYGMVALVLLSLINFNAITGPEAWQEWLLITPAMDVARHEKVVKKALLLPKITNTRARVAVVWAGALPYFSDRYALDLLGKSDRTIAHEDMRTPPADPSNPLSTITAFFPGHLKWDYSYSIGQLKPDIVAQLWESREEAEPYLDNDYQEVVLQGSTFYLLKGSDNIIWDKVKELQ